MRDKCRLLYIGRLDWNLMVGHRQVERPEHSGAGERVERFIKARQREAVKLRDLVQPAVVDAHAPAIVLLAHHHDR